MRPGYTSQIRETLRKLHVSPTKLGTMDNIISFISHWLPLIQGFAALASIAGALLSWKYAIKAQRARAQMTTNIVSANTLSAFESAIVYIRQKQLDLLGADGLPDYTAYKAEQMNLKHKFEEIVALASAANPYLSNVIPSWHSLLDALGHASINPAPNNVESASKHLIIAVGKMKIAATAREIQPADG